VIVGGHFGPVVDIAWEPCDGHYLVSVSSDQTARLHAVWRQSGKTADKVCGQLLKIDLHCNEYGNIRTPGVKLVDRRYMDMICTVLPWLHLICMYQEQKRRCVLFGKNN